MSVTYDSFLAAFKIAPSTISFPFKPLRTLPKNGHQEFPVKSFLIYRLRTLAENMGGGGVGFCIPSQNPRSLSLPFSANSFRFTLFADSYTLTPIESHRYKNHRGEGVPPTSSLSFTMTTFHYPLYCHHLAYSLPQQLSPTVFVFCRLRTLSRPTDGVPPRPSPKLWKKFCITRTTPKGPLHPLPLGARIGLIREPFRSSRCPTLSRADIGSHARSEIRPAFPLRRAYGRQEPTGPGRQFGANRNPLAASTASRQSGRKGRQCPNG
jgi:hypothetical protein